jgi:hypothetical protein
MPRDPSFSFCFGCERPCRRGWPGPRYSDFNHKRPIFRKRPIFQRDDAVGPLDERARPSYVGIIAHRALDRKGKPPPINRSPGEKKSPGKAGLEFIRAAGGNPAALMNGYFIRRQ